MVVHKTSRFSFFFEILSSKKASAGNSTGLFVVPGKLPAS
nr:MAG TPA: hypothetical protein [Caudoviricetes sp.]